MDIFTLLGTFIFGWICGELWAALKLRNALKKVAEDNGMTLEDLANAFLETNKANRANVHNLFTESTQNSILLYSKDSGAFICQGSTLDDLAKCAKEFSNIKAAIVVHDEKQLYFIDGEVKTTLNES